jgi:hypothetical protein
MGSAAISGGSVFVSGAERLPMRLKKYTAAPIKTTHKSKRTMTTSFLIEDSAV